MCVGIGCVPRVGGASCACSWVRLCKLKKTAIILRNQRSVRSYDPCLLGLGEPTYYRLLRRSSVAYIHTYVVHIQRVPAARGGSHRHRSRARILAHAQVQTRIKEIHGVQKNRLLQHRRADDCATDPQFLSPDFVRPSSALWQHW